RSALERASPPGGLLAYAVEVVAEKRSFNVFAEFSRCFMAAEGNHSDRIALGRLPFAVIPRSGHHEIGVIGIALRGVTEDLPRSPRIFLVPETRNIQIWHAGRMQLAHPSFLFPELVVIGMLH